jgi:bacterial/archaeal transporter family protein
LIALDRRRLNETLGGICGHDRGSLGNVGRLQQVCFESWAPASDSAVSSVGAIAFAVVVLTFERFRVDWSPAAFGWSFAAGFVNFIGFLTFFAAVERGKVSTVISLSSLYPVVTIVFSALLLHERISRREGFGIVLALAAGWLLAG